MAVVALERGRVGQHDSLDRRIHAGVEEGMQPGAQPLPGIGSGRRCLLHAIEDLLLEVLDNRLEEIALVAEMVVQRPVVVFTFSVPLVRVSGQGK